MFISEKYDNIKDFFNEYAEEHDKFKFSDLVKSIKKIMIDLIMDLI